MASKNAHIIWTKKNKQRTLGLIALFNDAPRAIKMVIINYAGCKIDQLIIAKALFCQFCLKYYIYCDGQQCVAHVMGHYMVYQYKRKQNKYKYKPIGMYVIL